MGNLSVGDGARFRVGGFFGKIFLYAAGINAVVSAGRAGVQEYGENHGNTEPDGMNFLKTSLKHFFVDHPVWAVKGVINAFNEPEFKNQTSLNFNIDKATGVMSVVAVDPENGEEKTFLYEGFEGLPSDFPENFVTTVGDLKQAQDYANTTHAVEMSPENNLT